MNRHDRRILKASGRTMFIFFREGVFYPIEIPADQLQANIDHNPGTLRVEDLHGNVLWRAPAGQAAADEESPR